MALGSGTQIQDVNRLLKQFKQMQKMMKKMGRKGAMNNMMRGLGGMMQQGVPLVSSRVVIIAPPVMGIGLNPGNGSSGAYHSLHRVGVEIG